MFNEITNKKITPIDTTTIVNSTDAIKAIQDKAEEIENLNLQYNKVKRHALNPETIIAFMVNIMNHCSFHVRFEYLCNYCDFINERIDEHNTVTERI